MQRAQTKGAGHVYNAAMADPDPPPRATTGSEPTLTVVAAVVVRRGRVLLTRRRPGSHLAGFWELPGGKIEPGEDPPTALRRELREELGVSCRVEREFAFGFHAYRRRRVLLLAYSARIAGTPRPLACASLGWFSAQEARALRTPPADEPIFARLLPLLEASSTVSPRRNGSDRAAPRALSRAPRTRSRRAPRR